MKYQLIDANGLWGDRVSFLIVEYFYWANEPRISVIECWEYSFTVLGEYPRWALNPRQEKRIMDELRLLRRQAPPNKNG